MDRRKSIPSSHHWPSAMTGGEQYLVTGWRNKSKTKKTKVWRSIHKQPEHGWVKPSTIFKGQATKPNEKTPPKACRTPHTRTKPKTHTATRLRTTLIYPKPSDQVNWCKLRAVLATHGVLQQLLWIHIFIYRMFPLDHCIANDNDINHSCPTDLTVQQAFRIQIEHETNLVSATVVDA